MSGDSSEEKEFEASDRKLQEARKRGEVPRSREVLTAVSLSTALFWLWSSWGTIKKEFEQLFDVMFNTLSLPIHDALVVVAQTAGLLMLATVVPLLAIVIALTLLASLIMSGGPMFSAASISPKLENISPIAGAKRIFGVKALKVFGLNILKVLLFGAVVTILIRDAIGALVLSVRSGMPGPLGVFHEVLTDLIIAASVLMVIFAIADYSIQKSAFLAEMRMTKSEVKRESKDSHGNPQIKGHRNRIARKAAERPSSLKMANFIVFDGKEHAVAMRYVKVETLIPVVVARSRGASIQRMLDNAPHGCPVIRSGLAIPLSKSEPGDYMNVDLVKELGPLMAKSGLI